MNNWNVAISCAGEEPQPWACIAMEDDRDAYRCLLSLLLDLRARYDNPKVYVNEKFFRPKEEALADYAEYGEALVQGAKPDKPALPVNCMSAYVEDAEEYRRELRQQQEMDIERRRANSRGVKVQVR